jgi:Ferritin-like domain
MQEIVTIAAVAEALATTFYYNGVTRRVGRQLDEADLVYFKAALAQEKDHLDLLVGAGASAPPDTFYFQEGTFSGVEEFTTVLLALEKAFIGAYAAAIERFCQLGEGGLAKLASRILGVEAEHRALGRDVAGKRVPNNLCLERAPFTCVSEATEALAPFLSDGPGRTAFRMPTDAQIEANWIPCKD